MGNNFDASLYKLDLKFLDTIFEIFQVFSRRPKVLIFTATYNNWH